MKIERFFVDTNLFLRYLTNDVPTQADAVEALLQRARLGEITLVTNSLVIAEIVWTLESYYQRSRMEVQHLTMAILNTSGLEVPEREVLFRAILWYAEKNVDFIDAYNAAWLSTQGLSRVYTFDRKHFSCLEELTIYVPEASNSSQ